MVGGNAMVDQLGVPSAVSCTVRDKVSNFICSGQWCLPAVFKVEFPALSTK